MDAFVEKVHFTNLRRHLSMSKDCRLLKVTAEDSRFEDAMNTLLDTIKTKNLFSCIFIVSSESRKVTLDQGMYRSLPSIIPEDLVLIERLHRRCQLAGVYINDTTLDFNQLASFKSVYSKLEVAATCTVSDSLVDLMNMSRRIDIVCDQIPDQSVYECMDMVVNRLRSKNITYIDYPVALSSVKRVLEHCPNLWHLGVRVDDSTKDAQSILGDNEKEVNVHLVGYYRSNDDLRVYKKRVYHNTMIEDFEHPLLNGYINRIDPVYRR